MRFALPRAFSLTLDGAADARLQTCVCRPMEGTHGAHGATFGFVRGDEPCSVRMSVSESRKHDNIGRNLHNENTEASA